MELLALTISLSELSQLAAILTGAESVLIEVRRAESEKEFLQSARFEKSPGPQNGEANHQQVFESVGCRMILFHRKPPHPLDDQNRHALALICTQANRQVELKQASQESQRRIAQSVKMSALGEMASGIAHEINNPLAIIQGHLNKMKTLIENDILENNTLMESVRISSKTVVRLGKIVEGLRNFARDGAGDPFQKVELFQVVNETLSLCQARFVNHNVKMNVSPISRSTMLECRPVEISQVILNLLSNAFDATAESSSERWIHLKTLERESEVELRVSDSGQPIAPEIRDKMFQPFFTTKVTGKGTGLGLSISKGIIEGHEGTLHLAEGEGMTEFVIRLPKVQRSRC